MIKKSEEEILKENFQKKMDAWLFPLGYQIIFKENNPPQGEVIIHYIKEGIRLICKIKGDNSFCYLYTDMFSKKFGWGTLRTRDFYIGENIAKHHKKVLKMIKKWK